MKTSIGNKLKPPGPNEIEIIVFGKGTGECICVHLGNGEWIIVDSFLNRSGTPVAQTYLESLGVDLSTQVKQIITTHWHDDHINGLSKLFKKAVSAKLVCTNCANNKLFNEILSTWEDNKNLTGGSGIDEMNTLFNILNDRKKGNYPTPKIAIESRPLYRNSEIDCEITALSPSDTAFATSIAKGYNNLNLTDRIRIPSFGENDASIVLSIRIGEHFILLGADLEKSKEREIGWRQIIESKILESNEYQVFKTPHHGSANGHVPELWKDNFTHNIISIVTPFRRCHLPRPETAQEIVNLSHKSFITAPSADGKYKHPDPATNKEIQANSISTKKLNTQIGFIRLRKKIDCSISEDWEIYRNAPAMELQHYINSL